MHNEVPSLGIAITYNWHIRIFDCAQPARIAIFSISKVPN
jgi:hypothetical protein